MKKIAILALITFSFLRPFNAQSQTKEETIDWLKSKIGMLPNDYQKWYNLRVINGKVYLTYVQGLYDKPEKAFGAIRIDFSKITSISYQQEEKSFKLILTGKFDAHDNSRNYGFDKSFDLVDIEKTYNSEDWFGRFIKDDASKMQLNYFTDLVEMKRIVKAYEHLTTLCGAKLVKDDLFKN